MPRPGLRRRAASTLAALALPLAGSALELSGSLGSEVSVFGHDPLFDAERRHAVSLHAAPEIYHAWDGDRQSFLLVPFGRVDSADPQRTHADLREALYRYVGESVELRAGIGKVFWGVTESRHLVDIVNQSDLVENVDGEDKLGQPLLALSVTRGFGTIDLFVLPYFRERTFPGRRGRLRPDPPVDTGRPIFESSARNRHVDFALRYFRVLGDFDIGLHHFRGTARDPLLVPAPAPSGAPVLRPHYDVIDQSGLDLQLTRGSWLWKLEMIHRTGQGATFNAAVGGFEYTLFGVADGTSDLGLLAEYLWDDRGSAAPQPFADDLFVGARLALNDASGTELLAGAIFDLDGGARVFSVEGGRRLGDRWRLELEARLWSAVPAGDLLASVRRDDHVRLTLLRYF